MMQPIIVNLFIFVFPIAFTCYVLSVAVPAIRTGVLPTRFGPVRRDEQAGKFWFILGSWAVLSLIFITPSVLFIFGDIG